MSALGLFVHFFQLSFLVSLFQFHQIGLKRFKSVCTPAVKPVRCTQRLSVSFLYQHQFVCRRRGPHGFCVFALFMHLATARPFRICPHFHLPLSLTDKHLFGFLLLARQEKIQTILGKTGGGGVEPKNIQLVYDFCQTTTGT